MIRIVNYTDVDSAKWMALVKASSTTTWFQTQEAYCFFDSLSFMEAFAVAVESESGLKGVVVGYIQKDGGQMKRFLSRRAIIAGGPLLSDDITDDELRALLNALKAKLKRRAIYIETRNFNDYSRWNKVFEECGFAYEPHYDVIVDTSSMDVVNSKLDRNRKRNIKKAVDNGIEIDKNPNEEDVHNFYSLLKELYKTKVKTPICPYEFFEKLRKLPFSLFCIAKDETGKVVGGLLCVTFPGKAVYAWYACGEDEKYKKLSPSVMSNYAGICHAAENGFPRFDFMGAGKPEDGGYGVRDFKLKFGGELVEYGRYKYVANHFLYRLGEIGVKVLKKL